MKLLHGQAIAMFWLGVQSFQFIEETKSKSNSFADAILGSPFGDRKPTGKLLFIIEAKVSEHQVGVSNNSKDKYIIKFELKREEVINNNTYMIFSGWGDPMNGGHTQFESQEIGLEKETFIEVFQMQIKDDPEYFSKSKLQKTKGLEKVAF